MNTLHRTLYFLLAAVVLASCGSMQPATHVADDVYYMPSKAPASASTARPAPAPVEEPRRAPATTDDYYDPGTSKELGADRNYYDMTYNDPYYYNYGRFGFNTAPMGWQTGWNGPGWGGGMGWGGGVGWGTGMGWGSGWNMSIGYGTGMYSGWHRPMWGYDPWAWNSPWGWNSPWSWNRPWGMGGGWGYGGYYSPWGNCYGCYAPVIIGDGGVANSTMIRHRSPMGSRSGLASGEGVRRTPVRNPVGLAPVQQRNATAPQRRDQVDRDRQQPVTAPSRDRALTPQRDRNAIPQRDRNVRDTNPSRGVDRSAPNRSPSYDGGGGGGRTSPSRDTGGGGGGTRTSPGRR